MRALKEEGYRVILVNSNPATIMTDPELADRTYIEPVTPEWVAQGHRAGAPRRAAAHDGRPDRAQRGDGARRRRHARAVRGRADRRQRSAPSGSPRTASEFARGDAADRARHAGRAARSRTLEEALAAVARHRLPRHHPPVVHARRLRRRHRLQPRGVRGAWSGAGSSCRRWARC